MNFDGISQSMGNEADQATFTFGNADRVMRDLANDVDLFRASIEFSLFHVGTLIKLDLWKGDVVNWQFDSGAGVQDHRRRWPLRTEPALPDTEDIALLLEGVQRRRVPVLATAGAMDLVHFPSADATQCDKGYDTTTGAWRTA